MFGVETGTAEDYHELNAGAHRKPPKVLSAPSLVWHLAFWTNFPEPNKDGELPQKADGPQKKSSKQIRDVLDRFIVGLRHAIARNEHVDGAAAKVQLTPCISGVYLLFGNAVSEAFEDVPVCKLRSRQRDVFESTSRMVTLHFIWRKLDVTIRFEIHTEYFAVSTFVELDKDRVKAGDFSSMAELNDSMVSVLKYLSAPAQPENEEEVVPINRYCFHDFWKIYEREILSDPSLTACASDPVFQHIFADFRGFVASDQAVRFRDDDFFNGDKPAKWGMEAKKKLLPLVQHRNRADRTRHECAVNYMLDGRALYMSTLGPPQLNHAATPADDRIPVEFIIYAHQRFNEMTVVNKWQLGRLVNQILLLGTLRLCALKDVKLLHEAGQHLGRLEESTQKARDAIASTEAGTLAADTVPGAGPKQSVSSLSAETMKWIAEAHKKLNDITGTFLKATGTGLLYRIERSRYYVQQFEANVKLLRVSRLEGDQPYDQFIRRRLGSEFDFINRLGIRYERATASIVTLDQNYLAITQNALVERANKIDEDTNTIQSDIHTIQEWGEFALLAALVPYYVMHLLDLIIKEKYVPVLTASVWTVFGVIALYRKFKNVRYVLAFLIIAVPVVATVAWPLLFGPAAGGSILRAYEIPEKQIEMQGEILGIQRKLEKLADQQLTVLKDLVASQKRPDDQKQDLPQPAPAEPVPKP
jgi:hypothetical protein